MAEPRQTQRSQFDGDGRGDKKHSNPNRMQTPDDIDDPTTRRDSTTPTLWERAKQHYLYFLTLVALAFSAVAVSIAFGLKLVPELVTNKYLLGGGAILALIATVYTLATKQAYGRTLDLDWLVYISGTSVGFYAGEFEAGGRDQTSLFYPYKGFSLFGHTTEPYEVQEIDPDAARHWKSDTEADDPASINLDEAPGDSVRTDYGTIVGAWTGGIEPQPKGTANLRLTEPENVDARQYSMMASQLEKKQRALELERDAKQTYRQFIDENLSRVQEPFEDTIEQDLQRAAFIAHVGSQRPGQGHRTTDEIGMTDITAMDGIEDLSEFRPNDTENGQGVNNRA
jgi:hypothetical protein